MRFVRWFARGGSNTDNATMKARNRHEHKHPERPALRGVELPHPALQDARTVPGL
jgi:hypothetical protein